MTWDRYHKRNNANFRCKWLSYLFPTLFPNGVALPMQSRYRQVKMHEYVLHLIRYHDNRFGIHPRFYYFVLNLMMRHRSQGISSMFVKKNLEDSIPTTIENLHLHIQQIPNTQLVEEMMHFGSSLRGTHAYWSKHCGELMNMIN